MIRDPEEDITTLVSMEDIHEVMGKTQVKFNPDVALDFSNELLYYLEASLEEHLSTFAQCQCGTTLRIRDLVRGYCTSCFGAITVNVSGKRIKP